MLHFLKRKGVVAQEIEHIIPGRGQSLVLGCVAKTTVYPQQKEWKAGCFFSKAIVFIIDSLVGHVHYIHCSKKSRNPL